MPTDVFFFVIVVVVAVFDAMSADFGDILPFLYAFKFLLMNKSTDLYDLSFDCDSPLRYSPVRLQFGKFMCSPFASKRRKSISFLVSAPTRTPQISANTCVNSR